MAVAEGNNTIVAMEAQSALGTPAGGAGGTAIRVMPSAGLSFQAQTIESAMLDTSGGKSRQRQGSQSVSAVYDSELQVGNFDLPFAGVLGQTDAKVTLSNTELGTVAVSGSGTILTFTTGDLWALDLYAGRYVRFSGMSTAGNNGAWVPILTVPTALTATIPTGYLVDQAADSAFTMEISKSFRMPLIKTKTYYTVEQYMDIDRSLVGYDQRFTGLNFEAQPNQMVRAGFSMGGLDLNMLDGASSPLFTSPTYGEIAGADSMSMLDGSIYVNGVDTLDLTGMSLGISASPTITPLLRRRIGLSVGVPGMAFAGQLTGLLQDASTFTAFKNETSLQVSATFRQGILLSSDFVGVYLGNASYGNWNAPITDGDTPVTLPLYAGLDKRGEAIGYARTTMVVSTSAP